MNQVKSSFPGLEGMYNPRAHLIFKTGEHYFALRFDLVTHILGFDSMHESKHLPGGCMGWTNFKGGNLVLLDTLGHFQLGKCNPDQNTVILVVDLFLFGHKQQIGIIANKLMHVTAIESDEFQEHDQQGSFINTPLVINTNALLKPEEFSGLFM